MPFWLLFWLFLAKKLPTLVAYSHSSYGWVKKGLYLPPPVIIIKIIPTIPFSDKYRVCVLPGQSKFVMVAIRIIIKPLCFSMMNKILSFFAILATFLATFGKKHTPNFPAQYRIDHLLLRISQIQSAQSILSPRFTFRHGVTTLTGWTVKKVKSSLFCTMNLENKNEKMIISSFLGPPNK